MARNGGRFGGAVALGPLLVACAGEPASLSKPVDAPSPLPPPTQALSMGAPLAAASSAPISYRTDFGLTESPISERGAWRQSGLDWTPIATKNGVAFGTQAIGPRPESQHYNDSFAYLSGFPANQRAQAIISKQALAPGCTHEVELLLRWSDRAHAAQGYECNLAHDGEYSEIVRWNGPLGSFTPLSRVSVAAPNDGDELAAEIVGHQIKVYLRGELINSADIGAHDGAVFEQGNPGIGLYRGVSGCGTLGDFGFTSFAARGLEP